MDTNLFNYRVLFSLYASVRTNVVPKPGILSLDAAGILTLTDTASQQIVVQKPLAELVGVRPMQLGIFTSPRSPGVVLYIGLNEAYKVVFGSESPALNNGLDVYEKLLSGDRQGAVQALKDNNGAQVDKTSMAAAVQQANSDYATFIAKAKDAGVYKSPRSSAPFIATVAVFCIVIGLFVFLYLQSK